MKSKMQDATI